MAQTWTDTTYKLDGTEMTILTSHPRHNQVSLYVPGYSLGGNGFSIFFTPDHIELLETLLDQLKQVKAGDRPSQAEAVALCRTSRAELAG
jgi:hypothetical protein